MNEHDNLQNPGFGEPYGGRPYQTPDGDVVYMWRKGQRVRFYAADARQVGPEHRNVVPAVAWAHAHDWFDPTCPAWSRTVTTEIRVYSHPIGERPPS